MTTSPVTIRVNQRVTQLEEIKLRIRVFGCVREVQAVLCVSDVVAIETMRD